MFKNDKSMDFLNTPEYREAPVLGTWNAYYITSISFFVVELFLFSYLSFAY